MRAVGVGVLARASPFRFNKRGKLKMSSASQVVHVSRNANNGSNARVFTLNANNDASNRNRNIGTHLAVCSVFNFSLLQGRGEYDDPIRLGSTSEKPGNQQR